MHAKENIFIGFMVKRKLPEMEQVYIVLLYFWKFGKDQLTLVWRVRVPLRVLIFKNRSELSGIPTLRLVHEYLKLIEHLSGHGRVMVALPFLINKTCYV